MTQPPITPKQTQLLIHLARFRFLDRIQLQHLLNHQSPTRIKDWLKDLTEHDYIGRIYSTNFGENTKPAIYYLKLKGIQQLRTEHHFPGTYLRTLYRDAERSDAFKHHCSNVAQIYLELQERNRHGHTEEFPLYVALTTPELLSSPLSFLSPLHPDLVVQKKLSSAEDQYFLLTILEPTMPHTAIRNKLKSVITFYFSGAWEERMDTLYPLTLLVCPTKPFLIITKRLAKNLLKRNQEPEEVRFRFAQAEHVTKLGITGIIWEVLR